MTATPKKHPKIAILSLVLSLFASSASQEKTKGKKGKKKKKMMEKTTKNLLCFLPLPSVARSLSIKMDSLQLCLCFRHLFSKMSLSQVCLGCSPSLSLSFLLKFFFFFYSFFSQDSISNIVCAKAQ